MTHLIIFSLLLLLSLSFSCAKPFKYLTYSQIHHRLVTLASKHPSLLRVYSAQQTFLLPHVGNCTQLASDGVSETNAPCTIWVVELTNFATLKSNPERPELLISGLLHGDEVVGPHAVLAYIELMLRGYQNDAFIRRMVDNRYVTLIPMTNAVGFHNREREERQARGISFDPNRDFGFNQKKEFCMRTVAGRVVNELFRVHLFRILVTFHGGTNVIGYEWGDNFHCEGARCQDAPDMKIMEALGDRMSQVAGDGGGVERSYPVGDMGSLVYPVNGGMEDWAYGASWSGHGVECRPATLGGYAQEKVRIEKGSQRCVTYLVETAREKRPEEGTLGGDESIMKKGMKEDGHVPRNVRLIVAAVDAVEPYVVLKETIEEGKEGKMVLKWGVGGGFVVDGTALQWSEEGKSRYGVSRVINRTMGWKEEGGSLTEFEELLGDDLVKEDSKGVFVRIVVVLDQMFAVQPNGSVPNVSPQSHLMGARASTRWNFSSGERRVIGKELFTSDTYKVTKVSGGGYTMVKVSASWGLEEGHVAHSQSDEELFELLTGGRKSGTVVQITSGLETHWTIISAVAGVLVIVSIAVGIFIFARRRRRAARRSRRSKHSFALTDDDDMDERRALTPMDEEAGFEDDSSEEVVAASGLRGGQTNSH